MHAFSISDNQLSDDNSLNDVKDTTFSNDALLRSVSSVGDNNQNIIEETKKPVKFKSTKKKGKVSQGNFFSFSFRKYSHIFL